jgi:nitroreductase
MREQRAVRAGKASYYKNIILQSTTTSVGLRRNIHRLEKALVMRPRRKSFARDYILETVEWYRDVLAKVQKGQLHDQSELAWAQNVLTEYFSVVEATGDISRAKQMFASVDYNPKENTYKPFVRTKPDNLPSYQQLLELSLYRRSVRWFTKKPVNRKTIDNAVLIARQSPTACNREPYEFRFFDDPKLVKQVANTPFGTGGYADNIPVIGVVIGKLDSYFSARDRHAIYTDASLATMGLVYGLEVQGVSSCLINWPDFEPLERKMQKLLNLRVDERPIMLIAIGYEDKTAMVPRSVKKELDTIRSYNKI